ncbi:hypothetical protein GPECTOR_17g889 [Gonium pectorale]|uniref:Protein kinase domain-containing protein n=1 Tax=Gonium pectorale TaxID=33097 RepID=A0A150GKE1_GONPE|nr:hypothetical protein GPECTOR_17g889 [Gonium pectorale]|eukprot:KXZ50251.1 hypothetical protein GPECTOR_17g889 [Gonium pectorale]
MYRTPVTPPMPPPVPVGTSGLPSGYRFVRSGVKLGYAVPPEGSLPFSSMGAFNQLGPIINIVGRWRSTGLDALRIINAGDAMDVVALVLAGSDLSDYLGDASAVSSPVWAASPLPRETPADGFLRTSYIKRVEGCSSGAGVQRLIHVNAEGATAGQGVVRCISHFAEELSSCDPSYGLCGLVPFDLLEVSLHEGIMGVAPATSVLSSPPPYTVDLDGPQPAVTTTTVRLGSSVYMIDKSATYQYGAAVELCKGQGLFGLKWRLIAVADAFSFEVSLLARTQFLILLDNRVAWVRPQPDSVELSVQGCITVSWNVDSGAVQLVAVQAAECTSVASAICKADWPAAGTDCANNACYSFAKNFSTTSNATRRALWQPGDHRLSYSYVGSGNPNSGPSCMFQSYEQVFTVEETTAVVYAGYYVEEMAIIWGTPTSPTPAPLAPSSGAKGSSGKSLSQADTIGLSVGLGGGALVLAAVLALAWRRRQRSLGAAGAGNKAATVTAAEAGFELPPFAITNGGGPPLVPGSGTAPGVLPVSAGKAQSTAVPADPTASPCSGTTATTISTTTLEQGGGQGGAVSAPDTAIAADTLTSAVIGAAAAAGVATLVSATSTAASGGSGGARPPCSGSSAAGAASAAALLAAKGARSGSGGAPLEAQSGAVFTPAANGIVGGTADPHGGASGPQVQNEATELLLGRDVLVDTDDPSTYLGHGTSGVVRRGMLRQEDGHWRPVAVKLLNRPSDQAIDAYRKHLKTLLQEMTILGSLRHPNIVQLLGGSVSLHSGDSFLVEELCDRTLSHAIYDENTPYNLSVVLRWCVDVAAGLAYLHPNIVHRDLKPSNVLLTDDGTAKISDFGLARFKLHTTLITRDAEVGTTCYMSPECFVSNDYKVTAACDVYSLGVVMNEMVTRTRPWSGVRSAVVGFKVAVVGDRPKMAVEADPLCPPPLRELIAACWAQQPEERPSSAQVLARLQALLADLERPGGPAWAQAGDIAGAAAEAVTVGEGEASGGAAPPSQSLGSTEMVSLPVSPSLSTAEGEAEAATQGSGS